MDELSEKLNILSKCNWTNTIFYCENCFNYFHNKLTYFIVLYISKIFNSKLNEIKLPQLCKGKYEPHSKIL